MSAGSDIVVIDGVRYRRADAERRGLLSPASAPSTPAPLTTATANPEPVDADPVKRGFLDDGLTGGLNMKGRKPKNKAADPEDK